MSKLAKALKIKIDLLREERCQIDEKIELLQELLDEEDEDTEDEESSPVARPAASKNKSKKNRSNKKKKEKMPTQEELAAEDPVLAEALRLEGTDPELAARLANRKFTPAPRPVATYGGVTAGRKKDVAQGKNTITGTGKRQLSSAERTEEL